MKPKTFFFCNLARLLLLSLIGAPLVAHAAETLINFDDVADATLINTHYAGVIFTNPVGGNIVARSGLGNAPSAPNVVCITNGGVLPFFDSPFGAVDARFAGPVRVVKIDARPVSQVADHLDPTVARPYLQAFDASGTLLATVYYAGALPQGCCWEVGSTETLTITSSSANIARARFSSQQPVSGVHTYGMFDNLRFGDGYYTLTVNIVGGGLVLTSPLGPYPYGSTPSLTASPFVDWVFAGWSGDINTTLNPVLPIMDANKIITATFVSTAQTGPNFVVTTTADHDDGMAGASDCTLREAINAANANPDDSIITFAPNVTGVITLQLGQLTINQNLRIAGPGARVLAISGNNSSRVFNVLTALAARTMLISDLTITNGRVTGLTGSPGQIGGGTGGRGGDAFGGGIYNAAFLTLSNCWVIGNVAQGGTGGVGGEDDATHPGGTGGTGGDGAGGGIYGGGNSLTLLNCTVSGNSTVGGPGGSGFDAFDNFFLTGGTGGSGGGGLGGGVFNDGIGLDMANCTLSGNSAKGGNGGRGGNGFPDDPGGAGGPGGPGRGGGVGTDSPNPLIMASCTLSLNSSSAGAGGPGGTGRPGTAPTGSPGTARGGGIEDAQGSPPSRIENSLIAGNSSLTAPDCSGEFLSQGYNLVGIVDGSLGLSSPSDQTGTSGAPLPALLGSLQFNGGAVPTMQLLPGSPAIDKGKSPQPTDARGRVRPYDFPAIVNASGGNGSDIGAYEVNPTGLNIAKSSSNVVLSWSTNEVGFALQSATQLSSPTIWTVVPGRPAIVGSQYTVMINNPAGKRFYRLIEVGSATIPGLFNTGVGASGTPLPSGSVDPHWQLIQSADAAFPGPNAIVVNDAGFPIPPWLANGPASKWLAPQASQTVGNQPGDYKYRLNFDLTGLEPSTVVMNGHWTSDNTGPQVLLNGTPTGGTSDGNFGTLGNAFTINTGFIAGVNTLEFVVNNGGPGINPTGVRVELNGTANRQPTP